MAACVCVWERERETERETEKQTAIIDTNLGHIFRSLLLTYLMGVSQPGDRLAPFHLTCLRADCSPNYLINLWPRDPCYFIIFLTPSHFFGFPNHVIHFCCSLFILRHRCNILFTKSTITGCQRLIWNTLIFSLHLFLSSITLGRFSKLHPMTAQSCCT